LYSPQKGFLLADGTGAGKTIQMLCVAAYFYQKTKKPVTIFTIDDKLIRTSFMEDGLKMGFSAPEYAPVDEVTPVQAPKNYMGLYDSLDDKPSVKKTITTKRNSLPHILYGIEKKLAIRDGINMFTYNALSHIKVDDKLQQALTKAHEVAKINANFWKSVLRVGMDSLKGESSNPQIRDNIYNLFMRLSYEIPQGVELRKKRWHELVMNSSYDDTKELQKLYSDITGVHAPSSEKAAQRLIEAEDRYTMYIKNVLREIYSESSLVIFDEAHKIKNLLLNMEKQAGRAYYAKFITSNANSVMFLPPRLVIVPMIFFIWIEPVSLMMKRILPVKWPWSEYSMKPKNVIAKVS